MDPHTHAHAHSRAKLDDKDWRNEHFLGDQEIITIAMIEQQLACLDLSRPIPLQSRLDAAAQLEAIASSPESRVEWSACFELIVPSLLHGEEVPRPLYCMTFSSLRFPSHGPRTVCHCAAGSWRCDHWTHRNDARCVQQHD